MKSSFVSTTKIVSIAILSSMAVTVSSAVVEQKAFDQYDVILERKPFGEYVAPVAPDSGKQEEQKSPAIIEFEKYIKMCAITDSARGVRVGLRNHKEKPPRTYFLYVGDADGEVSLLDADYQQGWARFNVAGEELELSLTSEAAPQQKVLTKTSEVKKPMGRPTHSIPVPRSSSSKGSTPKPKMTLPEDIQESMAKQRLSYAERRKMQLDEKAREAEKAKKLEEMARKYEASKGKVDISAEERTKRLQNDMMELIRAGKTSDKMPIVLTPEMEKTLVDEGVLPPTE